MAAEQQPAASWGADTDGRLNQSSEHLTEHAMLSTDASGNTVLVGGDGMFPTPASNGLRTVLIGDSYIDREMNLTTGNRTHQSSWGSIMWANFLLGSPLQIIKEMGIGGERVSDILARVDRVAAFNPRIIFVSCGINDLKNTVNPGSSVVTGEAYQADTKQVELPYVEDLYSQLLAKLEHTGATIFVMAITSPNGGDLNKYLTQRTMHFNRWLQYKCDQSANLHYLDVDRVTFDPLVTTGEILSGYYSDTIHKSIKGAFKAGQRIAAKIKPVLAGNLCDRLPTSLLETYSNMVIGGTRLDADGTNLVVTLDNTEGSVRRLHPGDRVAVGVPSAGNTAWDGVYTLSSVSDTTVTMPCTVAAGTYTGTVNVSNATQMFANPLFATQTGGSVSGGLVLNSGAVAGFTVINGPATSSVTVTYAAHTDLDGVATGLGYWLEMDFVGGANDNVKILFSAAKSNPATTYYGRIFKGDTINACGDLELMDTPSGIYSLQAGLTLNYYDDTGTLISGTIESLYRSTGSTEAHPNLAFRGSFQTCDWTLPSGVLAVGTGMTVDGRINLIFGAAGGACKIRVARFGVNRVDNVTRDATTSASYQ